MNEAENYDDIPESAIREELARILQSSIFAQSERLGRFLRFTIESVLNHKSDTLKEYVIGTEVYDRKPPYHPSQDSIVRTEARRLRSKLKEYYESEGSADRVLIYFRPGSYVPVFRLKEVLVREQPARQFSTSSLLSEGRGVSIAVIPFKDVSNQPLSSACASAITDELIHELMRTEGCRVTSASSAVPLEQYGADLPAFAQKLGVHVFFEGSVRQEGSRLRVTARIVTADGFQLWSQRFETEPHSDEVFHVSEEIARSMIHRTRPELTSIVKLKASAGAEIWNTYPSLLRTEVLLDEGTPSDIEMALARFEEVSQSAPYFPRPFTDIAHCYYELALRGVGVSSAMIAEAKKKVSCAIELDPEMPQPRGCLAALLGLEWNWRAAESEFQTALKLGPHAITYRQYALFLAVRKRFDDSRHYLQRTQHLDAFSHRQKLAWARFFHVSRHYQEVDRHFSNRLLYGPLPLEARLYQALSYIELERLDEARQIALDNRIYAGTQPTVAASLAEILARCGDESLAHELVNEFKLLDSGTPISRFRQCLLALALGDPSVALSFLETAFGNREPELIWLSVDPRLDPLRSHPRFMEITEHVMSDRKH